MIESLLNKSHTTVSLKDCCEEIAQRIDNPAESGFERFVGLEHLETGETSIRNWGSTEDVTSSMKLFKTGDVIVARRNVYLRRAARAHFDGVCSGDGIVLRSNPKAFLPDLLPFLLNTDAFWEYVTSQADGTMSKRITVKRLLSYTFVLPPLEEQRRIAEVLQACQRASESLVLSAERASLVEYAFLRDAFGTRYGQSDETLYLEPLENVAEIRTGLAKGRKADSSTIETPYLRVANVQDGHLDLDEIKQIVVEADRVARYSLKTGDVLMTEGGDLDKLGRGTVWQGEIRECLHQNHVFAVRTDTTRLDPWYLAAVARSPYGRSFFLQNAKRSSNLASVNKTQLSGFQVPLMSLDAQRHWLAEYHAIRSREADLRSRAAQTSKLAAAVLRKAMQ
jgi:type I restriction enzyme, S subunit